MYICVKMDSRGWIPIETIASFNRVKTLTPDIRLVKDVLTLSSIVEVRDDYWVRMGGYQWQQFLLPDAPRSAVEPTYDAPEMPVQQHFQEQSTEEPRVVEGDSETADEVEEEEEDDVVFVMGRDVEESWTAGRRPT